MHKLIALSIVVAAIGGGVATSTAQAKTMWNPHAARQCPGVVKAVDFYKHSTWKWQQTFEIKQSKASRHRIMSCQYGTWVAKLWRTRAWRLRDLYHRFAMADRDFNKAASLAHEIFPSISTDRLWYRADAEGGHGGWVWNSHGSHAGGWFQFMEGTYYGRSDESFSEARKRGFPIPSKFNSFYSLLGQTVTAAYMFEIGLECSGEGWAASC